MKTFILILLFSLTTQVKQYQLYESHEGTKSKLKNHYMSVTRKIIFLKADSVIHTFYIDTVLHEHNKQKFLTYEFTERNDSLIVWNVGFIIIAPSQFNESTGREEGSITVEARNRYAYRKVIYKYR